MSHLLPEQLPWWVAGPGVGLCVVALYALANLKLGVSGGWLQLLFLAWTAALLVVGVRTTHRLGWRRSRWTSDR